MDRSRKTRLPIAFVLSVCALLLFAAGAAAGTESVARSVSLGKPKPAEECRLQAALRADAVLRKAHRPGRQRHARRISRRARVRCLARLRHRNARSSAAPEPTGTPQQPSGQLVIGVDGGYGGWSEREIEARIQLGAAVTRHEFDLAEAVNAQDDLVELAAGVVHTRIHALLGANELGDPTHYREWVVAFIRRYGSGGSFWREHPELDASRYAITTFELGNEPYFGGMSAQLYASTVRPTLEEVKRLGLPAKIVLPSRVYGTDTSWMDTLYSAIPNLNELFYAFADHPYWYGHDPAQISPAGPFGRISVLRRRMNERGAGEKPIFISEYGESTASCGSECVSESVQAQHLQEMVEAVVNHPEWGVEMLDVFQLIDRGTGSTDRELQFGLLRQNGTPKPSYPIVHEAIERYRG
jgi:hypothetical protein